jgi:hypothetical protein
MHNICTICTRYAQKMKAHTYNTYTYLPHMDCSPFICGCMLYVLQKYTYTYITHTYQIHMCKILHVSACMACMCMYMPVSACMNLNMHVASSNKWIVPKFLAGSLRSSRLRVRRQRMCESWTIYTTGSGVPISQWCQSLCHANLPVNPLGCALYWQSHVALRKQQADSEGPGTGHVGHILQPFQRRIGTAQMLSVPALAGSWRLATGTQSNLNSAGWQFKFVLEVMENGMLCCGQLELQLQSWRAAWVRRPTRSLARPGWSDS